jgi:hypothetical protein
MLERIIEELLQALKQAEAMEHSRQHHGGAFDKGLEQAADYLADQDQNSTPGTGTGSSSNSPFSGSSSQPTQPSTTNGKTTAPNKGSFAKGLQQLGEWWQWKHHHHYAEYHHKLYPSLPGRDLSVTMRPTFKTPGSDATASTSKPASKTTTTATTAKVPSTTPGNRPSAGTAARKFHEEADHDSKENNSVALVKLAKQELQKHANQSGKANKPAAPAGHSVVAHHVGSSVGNRHVDHPASPRAQARKKS